MRILPLLLLASLAGCSGHLLRTTGVPQDVALNGQILSVRMSNGSKCEADLTRENWTRGAPEIAGQMQGCDKLTYVIRPEGESLAGKVDGALKPYFAPYARVRLQDGMGHSWTYDLPTGAGRG